MNNPLPLANGEGVVLGDSEIIAHRRPWHNPHPDNHTKRSIHAPHVLAWLEIHHINPAQFLGQEGMLGGGMDRLGGRGSLAAMCCHLGHLLLVGAVILPRLARLGRCRGGRTQRDIQQVGVVVDEDVLPVASYIPL